MRAFSIYQPIGWTRIDLADSAGVELYVNTTVRGTPLTRQPLVRQALADHLVPKLTELRDGGVAAVLLPHGSSPLSVLRPVITFYPLPLGGVTPDLLVQALAAQDESARLVDVPGLVVLRTSGERDATALTETIGQPLVDQLLQLPDTPPATSTVELEDADALTIRSRMVRYVVGDPDDVDRWVDVRSVLEYPTNRAGRELADDTIALVDAMITTFRWVS